MNRFCYVLLIGLCLSLGQAKAQFFKDGDKVVFVGNSITMNGGFYHQLALYYATSYPNQRVDFINCGINGNFSNNVLSRMDEDILVHKLTWAVVMLGMNDVRKELYHPDSLGKPDLERRRIAALEVYEKNYELIIKRLLDKGVKVILQTPSIYDQTAQIAALAYVGRNDALLRCAEIVKGFGKKYKLLVVDYQQPMLAINKSLQSTDPSATLIGADRVHPGAAGHMVMALSFLAATEKPLVSLAYAVPPAVKVTAKQNVSVLEKGLPYPLSAEQKKMGSMLGSKFTDNLIRFSGLSAGSYSVQVDGIGIGNFTQAQLHAGLDLGTIAKAPQTVQASKVLGLFRKYWELEASIRYLRLVELYKQKPEKRYLDLKPKQGELETRMKQLLDSVYLENKPMAHAFQFSKLAAPNPTEKDVVGASQAGASQLFFERADAPEIKVSNFNDPRELVMRNGLPNFFGKLRAGKPVTVAFIGGSVTQMDNKYRNQTAKYLQSLYPTVKMKFINAGVSGTGTDLGAARLYDQVMQYNPDLVFMEFAVNGAYVPGMEGMIRQVHDMDLKTEICLLYAISTGQSAVYAKGALPENIMGLEKLADHYHLPSIHMGVETAALEASGKLVWKGDPEVIKDRIVFSKDGTHPTTEGGNLYAAAIGRSLNALSLDSKLALLPFPRPLTADSWADAKALDPSMAQFSRGWEQVATAGGDLGQFTPWFATVMSTGKPGSSFGFDFYGTKVGVFDIGGPEMGQLEVYVDGKRQAVINRFNRFCNNRYRGQYFYVDTKPGRHHIEFRVSGEIPDKRAILGEGQLEDITANPSKYNRSVVYIGKILVKGYVLTGGKNQGLIPKPQNEIKRDSLFDILPLLPSEKKLVDFKGFKMAEFTFQGRACKVVVPKVAAKGHPWVWRARFWGHEPQVDLALLEKGFHVVYCDVIELFGNQHAVKLWDGYYQLMRKAGLSDKVVLEGMSRGGVYIYNWAARNPEKVACIYADNPVLDLKSWPGGMGKGPGSKGDWQKVITGFGLDSESKIKSFKGSPIDQIDAIAKGGYPMLHVCGDADEVVPMEENSIPFVKQVLAAGGDITVIHKPGYKHHPHSLPDPGAIVDFVLRAVFN